MGYNIVLKLQIVKYIQVKHLKILWTTWYNSFPATLGQVPVLFPKAHHHGYYSGWPIWCGKSCSVSEQQRGPDLVPLTKILAFFSSVMIRPASLSPRLLWYLSLVLPLVVERWKQSTGCLVSRRNVGSTLFWTLTAVQIQLVLLLLVLLVSSQWY